MDNTLFGLIMNFLFGKRYALYIMRQRMKVQLLSDDMEIAHVKSKGDQVRELIEATKEKLEHFESAPLAKAEDTLPEDQRTNSKALYDENQRIEKERRSLLTNLRKELGEYEKHLHGEDGMLSELYSQTLLHREKWDFLKHYTIKKTYADKNND